MAVRARRTQQERRERTAALLLAATQEQLLATGLAGFTTRAVCQRAGVSEGALFKHFSTKNELLVAGIGHLFGGMRADYEAAFLALPAEDRTLRRGFDLLWESMWDPRLAAAYELYTVARVDEDLRAALGPVVEQHIDGIGELIVSLGGFAPDSTEADHVTATILMIQGLVLSQMVLADPVGVTRVRRIAQELLIGLADPDAQVPSRVPPVTTPTPAPASSGRGSRTGVNEQATKEGASS